MKIHLANYQERIGGGWSQAKYLHDAFNSSYDEAEVYLIAGPTQVSYEDVNQAKKDGKKIVLRLDNAVRDSRNRGTGMSRMKAFVDKADLVIYQSEWAREFLHPYTKKDGPVILNGVDTKKFNAKNRTAADDTYLYVRSSRDEGKGWINAWYWFVNNPGQLDIVGKFSPDNWDWNFDFFNGERWTFWGERSDLPDIYKRNKYFLYSYWCDACSNTLIEARASGCLIINVHGALNTGGAPEIMQLKDLSKERMLREYEVEIGKLL